MGRTFSSVVVAATSSDAIADEVKAWIVEGSWQASTPGSGGRELLITGPTDGWIAVYDEFLDGGADFGSLEECARRLSKQSIALASTVAHSDAFLATLAVRGETAGRIVYDPGESVWDGRWVGSLVAPARWAAAIGRPDVAPRLVDIIQRDYTFADERLGDIALSIGLPDGHVLSGLDDARVSAGPDAITLFFDTTQPEAPAIGPSRFQAAGHTAWPSTAVGGDWMVSVSARSVGGPGSSIDLLIWGPALAQGLVEPTGVRLSSGIGANRSGSTPDVLDEATSGEGRVLGGAFAFDIPGRAIGLATMGRRRGLAAWADSMVNVEILGEARQPGRAPLYVALVPDGDRESAATQEVDIWITEAEER